jgi:hypothetical protein
MLGRGTKGIPLRLVASTSIICLLTSGCASMESYRDAGDPCGGYRETLITANEDAENTFAVGAAVSAGVGLAAGIVCTVLTGNTKTCAGIGAGTAAAGTAISFWRLQRQKASNQAEIQAAIDGEARATGEKLTPIGAAVSGLNQCRMGQIAQLQQRVAARQIDRPVATRDLAVIDASIAKDQKLIDELLGKIDNRATQLAQDKAKALGVSFTSYEERLPTPQSSAAPRATKRQATAQAPGLSSQPKPRAKSADATSDLYLDSEELAVLNRQQHDELLAASGNLREMIDIGGGGTVRHGQPEEKLSMMASPAGRLL